MDQGGHHGTGGTGGGANGETWNGPSNAGTALTAEWWC